MPPPSERLNPLTALVTGISAWILVLGVNRWECSVAVIVVALALGMWRTRTPAVPATTALLALPTGLSMVLVHAPYGTQRIAPLLTSDGLITAGGLALRFTALMAALLAAAAFIRVPDLAKALQVSPLGPKFAYIVAAALQVLPQGRRTVRVVRDAQRLRGASGHRPHGCPAPGPAGDDAPAHRQRGEAHPPWRPRASTCRGGAPCCVPSPTALCRSAARLLVPVGVIVCVLL
ncbi:energy-coupling factor transporter transmembrane component T [Corynebacterium suedekumii]|nr:energy-coupling factor transporter transmembrane component T [Corynebacterium suedekumii]